MPVLDARTQPLPRGRHDMPRDEIANAQRIRIVLAMADAMHEKGYVGTPVADVLKRAGVSRETFYQLFSSKLDCYLAAFDLVGEALLIQLRTVLEGPGSAMERFERTLTEYLNALASEPAYARLFLVECHAAGPEAMERRHAFQRRLTDALTELLGATTEADRFAAQMFVVAVSGMVTGPLVAHDTDALRRLCPPLLEHVRRLADVGVFNVNGGAGS
jgi:AcrR family transcriptional regulator